MTGKSVKVIRKRKKLYIVTAILLLGGVIAGYYFGYYIPERQDTVYNASLARATTILMDDSALLLGTTSLPIFYDINEQSETCADNALEVSKAVSRFSGYLNDLERIANANQPAYLYNFGRDAAKTKARKIRSVAIVKQSRQVVSNYATMTESLCALAQIRKDYVSITTPLTVLVDLYDYFYRIEELRTDADSIDVLAGRVLSIKTPLGLVPIQTVIAAQYKETAAGYRDLADGLTLGNDVKVDAAARRIESAMEQLDSSVQDQYTAAMSQSALMKELNELPDKYAIE